MGAALLLAIVEVVFPALVGFDRERSFYATVLVVIENPGVQRWWPDFMFSCRCGFRGWLTLRLLQKMDFFK
jgi:hypothetical protein